MKKILCVLFSLIMLSGCSGIEKEDLVTYTTYYPFLYAANYMYGDFSDISSIYPSDVDIENYKLSDKQKNIYADGNMFIYSGTEEEVDLTVEFLNKNEKLKIIYATKDVNYTNGISEYWLIPSNYLKVARNIKTTLIDYEDNVYNQEKIEELYQELKIKISEIDVELTMTGKKASRTSILVLDDTLSYLSKYKINVISIDPDNKELPKNYNEAKKLIQSGDIKYIYSIKGTEIPEDIKTFIENYKLDILEIDPLYTLGEAEKKNGDDYITIMNANITKLRTELWR